MRILGIDPGTVITGFGIIECIDGVLTPVDFGCIRPPRGEKLSERYHIIFQSVDHLIERWKPRELSIESQYVSKNVQSARKLGMACASAIIAAKRHHLSIFEYTPSRAKMAVVGYGGANKMQMQQMTKQLLKLKEVPPEDAADALALAICHANARRWGKEI